MSSKHDICETSQITTKWAFSCIHEKSFGSKINLENENVEKSAFENRLRASGRPAVGVSMLCREAGRLFVSGHLRRNVARTRRLSEHNRGICPVRRIRRLRAGRGQQVFRRRTWWCSKWLGSSKNLIWFYLMAQFLRWTFENLGKVTYFTNSLVEGVFFKPWISLLSDVAISSVWGHQKIFSLFVLRLNY